MSMDLDDTQALSRRRAEQRIQAVDHTTGLPVLAALLPDLVDALAEGQRLGLIYLDLSAEARLESIYGWETFEQLLVQVANTVNTFRRDDLEAEGRLALYANHSDEFVLFVFLPSGEDHLQFLEHQRLRLQEHLEAQLTVQVSGESTRSLAIDSDSELVFVEPMVRPERALYHAIDNVRARCRRQRESEHSDRLRELRRIVRSGDVNIHYQPIVHLQTGEVLGYEALTRIPSGGVFETTEMLFTFAERSDHILELERLCRLVSIQGAVGLRAPQKLFLNCSAPGFTDPELFGYTLVEQAEKIGLKPGDIVIEITERVAMTAWQKFRRSVAALRLIGLQVALDDMGSGYSSLSSLADVEPHYLKVDRSLIHELSKSMVKQRLMKSLLAMATEMGARVIAEGVETADDFRVLRDMNVELAQGYLFARPAESLSATRLELPVG